MAPRKTPKHNYPRDLTEDQRMELGKFVRKVLDTEANIMTAKKGDDITQWYTKDYVPVFGLFCFSIRRRGGRIINNGTLVKLNTRQGIHKSMFFSYPTGPGVMAPVLTGKIVRAFMRRHMNRPKYVINPKKIMEWQLLISSMTAPLQ